MGEANKMKAKKKKNKRYFLSCRMLSFQTNQNHSHHHHQQQLKQILMTARTEL